MANSYKFPTDFLWGASTSAFQCEGNPVEMSSRASDWADWSSCQGKISDGTTADQACDFFNLYPTDIELARSLNLNTLRIGLNWAALCPDASYRHKFNIEMIDHYLRVLEKIKERGMRSFVTLFHFCLPRWLAEIGGWNNPVLIGEFERFAEIAASKLGEYVDFWITLNEPMVYLYQGYFKGVWPPGYFHKRLMAFEAASNMLSAHAAAYHAIKRICPNTQVSFAVHWRPFVPRNRFNPLHAKASELRNALGNVLWLDALKTGNMTFPHPLSTNKHLAHIAGPIPGLASTYDFIALNYFTREICQFEYKWPIDLLGAPSSITRLNTTPYGWEIYPEGLYEALTSGITPYTCDQQGIEKPVYITENGMATMYDSKLSEGNWSLDDPLRVHYILEHLKVVAAAIAQGVDVKGYLHWSLFDNFEWHDGLTPRFGLVRVAYPTQKRDLRDSAKIYAEIARSNSLPI